MNIGCPWCPLTQPGLLGKYCDHCEQDAILPDAPHRCHTLGLMLYRDDHFAAAAAAFRAANLHSDTFLSEPAFNLSLSEYRLSRFDAALIAIEQVLALSPVGEALYVKGLILQRVGRLDEAESWLLQADAAGVAKAQAQLADLRMRRDLEYLDSGVLAEDPEKRLACLTGVLARLDAPTPRQTAHVLSQMGRAATQLGDVSLARTCFRRACEEDLTAETATELAEFVLDYGGEEEEAAAEERLAQALALDDRHGRAWHCLGRLQHGRGQLRQAFHSMLSAVHASPTDEYTLFETAELATELGDVALCLSLLTRLEALANDDPYWLDRARTLRRAVGAY